MILQRLAIHKELFRAKDHPWATGIFQKVKKRFPNLRFDTVNQTVLPLADIGATRVTEGSGCVRVLKKKMFWKIYAKNVNPAKGESRS